MTGRFLLYGSAGQDEVRATVEGLLPAPPELPARSGLKLGRWVAGGTLAAAALAVAPELALGAAVGLLAWVGLRRRKAKRRARLSRRAEAHPLVGLVLYRRAYLPQVTRATALTLFTKLLDLTPPLIIALGIDAVTGGRIMAGLGLPLGGQFLALAALSVVLWGTESFCEYRFRVEWEGFANRLQHDMRVDAYRHVQQIDLAVLHQMSTGELVKVLNADLNQIERFFSSGLSELMTIGTNATFATLAVLAVAPAMAPFPLLPIPFVIWYSLRYERHLGHRMDAVQDAADRVNSLLANNIVGMPTIRSYTAERIEAAHLVRLSQDYVALAARTTQKTASYTPVIRLALLFGFTGTILVGGYLVQASLLSTGAFAFVMLITQRVLWPLTMLNGIIANYERTMVGARRVFRVLDLPPGPPGGTRALSAVRGRVSFEHVSFSYDGVEKVLEDFSLEVPAGRMTAIVGATGTGKTTLTRLLLCFYRCQEGRILLDGEDIRELRTEDLRRAIGLVSQTSFLFDGTAYDNIAYGRVGATPEEVTRAARLAEAHDFVEALPLGYQTPVGDRLSAGQAQRLCLARAILKDPPILILDEATSFVDNDTEAAIRRSLERISPGRTTIMIAHRLSTVCFANSIMVLGERGAILESGTHQELLARNGAYASLWRVQTGLGES